MPWHNLVLGIRLRYLRLRQELGIVQELLPTVASLHYHLSFDPTNLPPNALPRLGHIGRLRELRYSEPIVVATKWLTNEFCLGKAESLTCHLYGPNGRHCTILHFLDYLRLNTLRENQQWPSYLRESSSAKWVIRLPNFLVHPFLRAHFQLHLPHFLRIFIDQKVSVSQEINAIIATKSQPWSRDGQWDVWKLSHQHLGANSITSGYRENSKRVRHLQYDPVSHKSNSLHKDACCHIPRQLHRPRYCTLLHMLLKLQGRWPTEAVPILQTSLSY